MNQSVTITVTALDGTVLYTQSVQGIDMLKLTQLVNTPPPEPPKPKKKRSDAGKPRQRTFNSLPQLGAATE